MNIDLLNIQEVSTIDDIADIEEEYEKGFGIHPFNISSWDQCGNIKSLIEENFIINNGFKDAIDYIFSYSEEEIIENIYKKNNLSPKLKILITPTGSSSIQSVLYFLKNNGVKKLNLVCPVYFTVPNSCDMLGLEFSKIYITRTSQGYCFPINECLVNSGFKKSLWITNPIYCTSVYYSLKTIRAIENMSHYYDFIIIDECLSINENSLLGQISHKRNFIYIQCPHKTICINGFKFSLILFDKVYYEHFAQWSDVIQGGLNISNKNAILHYLGSNFTKLYDIFNTRIKENFEHMKANISRFESVEVDKCVTGHLATIYFNGKDGAIANNMDFIRTIIFKSGTSFIPGQRNHFSTDLPFCVRVNLARYGRRFEKALIRLIMAIQNTF